MERGSPYHANADQATRTADAVLLEEVGELVGRVVPTLLVLQFRANPFQPPGYCGDGERDQRPRLGYRGTARLVSFMLFISYTELPI